MKEYVLIILFTLIIKFIVGYLKTNELFTIIIAIQSLILYKVYLLEEKEK